MLTAEFLEGLEQEQRDAEILGEFTKCTLDPKYCIETYFTVNAGGARVPFKLFPHQVRTLDAYERYQNIITMKTRQMGFTTFTAAYIAWNMLTKSKFQVMVISKKMTDTEKFIAEIKDIINEVIKKHDWLCKGYDEGNNNKRSFTIKFMNSFLMGQSTTEDAGRGMSAINLLVVDEVAFIDRRSPQKMYEIVAAAGIALTTVRGKFVAISTPKGQSGWYYDTYTQASKRGFKIVDAHWLEHPFFKKGAYKWIPDSEHPQGGTLTFLNEEWPDQIYDQENGMYIEVDKDSYNFVLDGKTRSPWYDFESARLGPERTRCELDCSFMGTGGEVFDADILRALQLAAQNSPFAKYTMPFENISGLFKAYKEYIPYIPGHRYVLGADVATGDGSDFSAFSVIDIETLDVCATFKCNLLPSTYATIINLVGRRYGDCPVVVENAGGGGTTLQDLKTLGYPNIYYSILRKNDPSTGLKKRKIGLWPSEQVRWEGGDRLEEVIRNGRLKIHCLDIIGELYTWIWDKDGKRRHAPERNDDLLMGTQHAIYYIFYVIKRADRNRKVFNNAFEVQRNGMSIVLPSNQYTGLGGFAANSQRTQPVLPGNARVNRLNIERETGENLQRRRGFFL